MGGDEGFMIGGVPVDFGKNYRIGQGGYFVTEGDEYDTAFFDKGPKFLHYYPDYLLLNDIEFDHADIYRDLDHILSNFSKLLGLVGKEGRISASGDCENVRKILKRAECSVITYGYKKINDWVIKSADEEKGEVLIEGKDIGEISFKTKLFGRYNYANLTGVLALLYLMGFDLKRACALIENFSGVRRRQELVGVTKHIEIFDDFEIGRAHV